MSNHTLAWAIVREIPDSELRAALIDAHERMLDAADDLECPGDFDGAIDGAVSDRATLQAAADKLECCTSEVDTTVEDLVERVENPEPEKEADGTVTSSRLSTTEKRLESALREINTLREQIVDIVNENHDLRVELNRKTVQEVTLPEDIRHAVGDVLAMSRRLTTFCEAAGIKPAHLRVVRPRRKKTA